MDSNFLPSELISDPLPLIALFGLNPKQNPIHKSIWEAFSNNRASDRATINFKLLPQNYEFPVSKPKRQSYQWYQPKGILKRNWMLKHSQVLPAVVVLFQDIEWNDSEWSDKQLQCASQVQSLKNSLQERHTRLAIVLIQKGVALPPGEDLLASERAAALTSVCDINAKMLFILPHNDHLMGYVSRLESAFLELAQSYYAQLTKIIRSHRDQLTPEHLTLIIRHQFKLGFISELRLDHSTALKHYSQAYGKLHERRIVDTNCLEIKTIAGFLIYKTCRLMFKLNVPRDSINQFKTHVEKYKHLAGFKELLFEHYAWLSTQYCGFAELFCDAIKNGLPALQTQHPGIYFHKAAEYVGRRKEAFLQCCALSMSPTEPISPSVSINSVAALHSDFFGIRGSKTSEPITEQQIISLVQENERNFNHSALIIQLLGQAMAQFKVYKCLRFRKKLAVDMAEEYLKCGDHSRALTLYSLMLSDYRVDKWFKIFTEVLLKTLRSAYLSASVVDYVSCSIETFSPNILINTSERIIVLENLWKVLQNVAPVSQSQIAPELKSAWEQSLANVKSPIIIDLDKISEFLDCKLTFHKNEIKNDEKIEITLYIRSNTDVPLKLSKFSVIITDSKSNIKLNATHFGEYLANADENLDQFKEFLLEPKKCYKLRFIGEQYQFMENAEVQFLRIEIRMGSDRHVAILTQSVSFNKVKPFKQVDATKDCLDDLKIINSCYIIPTFHLTTHTKQHNQPMLVNEYFKISTSISNNFDVGLEKVFVSITIPDSLRNKAFLTTDLTSPIQKLSSQIQINIGDLQYQSTSTISYYLTSLVEGNIELKQRVWYETENLYRATTVNTPNNITLDSPTTTVVPVNSFATTKLLNNHNIQIIYLDEQMQKIREDTIVVPCVEAIKFSGRFYTLSRQALMRAYKNEDLLLRINVEVKAACDIDILDITFISDHNIIEKSTRKTSKHMIGSKLKKDTKIEDVLTLNPIVSTSEWITKSSYLKKDNKLVFHRHAQLAPAAPSAGDSFSRSGSLRKSDDVTGFNKNLLAKIPSNATIVGGGNMLTSSSLMTTSSTSSLGEDKSNLNITSDTDSAKLDEKSATNFLAITKNVYNQAIDGVHLTSGDSRGFFRACLDDPSPAQHFSAFGIYCMKWKRSQSKDVNESKFIINGIDVIEPPLNIYSYFDKKLYVRIPITWKITLKNPSNKIVYLQAILNGSDSFMYAGHRQLNITIFAMSNYELYFNLYPLKAGWQQLPELHLEYSAQNELEKREDVQQIELVNLVKRWLPKMVFIHPPSRNNLK